MIFSYSPANMDYASISLNDSIIANVFKGAVFLNKKLIIMLMIICETLFLYRHYPCPTFLIGVSCTNAFA